MKILCVDDSDSFRSLMDITLSIQLKHDVRYANNGKEAEEILKTFSPSLIITDIAMPEINGNDFIEHISDTGIPVVVLTSNPENVVKRTPPIIGIYNKLTMKNIKEFFREIICMKEKKL